MSSFSIMKMLGKRLLSRRELRFALTITLLLMAVGVIESCIRFYGDDINALPSAAYGWIWNIDPMQIQAMRIYLYFLIFIIASMVFADNFLEDTKSNVITCIATRCSLARYITISAFLVFFGGFFITLIPLILSQLLAFLIFPLEGTFATRFTVPVYFFTDPDYLFSSLAYNHPYLRNLVFACYASFWAGAMALLSFSISLFYKRNKLVVIGIPTLLSLFSWYLIPIINKSDLNLTHFQYLFPSSQNGGFSLLYFIIAPLVVLAVSAVMILLSQRLRRDLIL